MSDRRIQVNMNGYRASFINSDGYGWSLGGCESPPLGNDPKELERYQYFFQYLVGKLTELREG
jgi:hypothetical protein